MKKTGKPKRFELHRGPISLAKIAEGMNVARKNAARLAEDAKILLNAERVHSAVALAILSIEESGKLMVLRQMTTCESDSEWRDAWKQYRNHTKKNLTWIVGDLIRRGARTLDDMKEIADPNSDHPEMLDELKQLCLYTDCVNGGKWTMPSAVRAVDSVAYLIIMAVVLAKGADVTERELELWRKHLLPVKDRPFDDQKSAVANWYDDMRVHGLSSKSRDEVEAFLRSDSTH